MVRTLVGGSNQQVGNSPGAAAAAGIHTALGVEQMAAGPKLQVLHRGGGDTVAHSAHLS